ncbi:MAG: NAD(P)/FAD-dependent oxidoreductase [Clostridia bacterium]|nr:NAD(P)/FAD-dependent oxidoreductase [Clostridia bacterium]
MELYDLIIIGGGPAAWSCGMTARNRGLSCLVVTAGASLSGLAKAHMITNYPGVPNVSGEDLLASFRAQALDLGVEEKTGNARQVMQSGDQFMVLVGNDIFQSRSLVLSLGAARPKMLPGEEEMLGHGLSWCGTCDAMFHRNQPVAVISSWNGGAEEAEFLANVCSSVDYYTLARHDLPEASDKIHLLDAKPLSVTRSDAGSVLRFKNADGTEDEKAYHGIFVFRPSVAPSQLLPGLRLRDVFIEVDTAMRTSVPLVYACGDCTGRPLQIAKAVGEGNIAAISAAEDLQAKDKEKNA